MWIYIFLAILLLLFLYSFSLYNSFIKLSNKVTEAFSIMDVYLKKRWDLIPNLVETVKGYANYEKGTLKEVIDLRNGVYDKFSHDEKVKTNEQLSEKIKKLMSLAEAYPDLKANDSFKDLSNQLIQIENDIANSRKYYNGVVRAYNTKIEVFPNHLFARLFGYKSKAMFEASDHERNNVSVDL